MTELWSISLFCAFFIVYCVCYVHSSLHCVCYVYSSLCMQVRVYEVASMSCSYVLAGHTEIVVCIDTCISSTGKTMVVTGSKDNSVSSLLFCFIAVL